MGTVKLLVSKISLTMKMPSLHANFRPQALAAGFTIIELMVTVAIVGIIASIAVPSFSRLIQTNRLVTRTNDFVAVLNSARSEAIRLGGAVTVRSTDAAGDPVNGAHLFNLGWVSFRDTSGSGANGTLDVGEVTVRKADSGAGTTVLQTVTRTGTAPSFVYTPDTSSSNRMFVTFDYKGALFNRAGAVFFRLCDSADATIPGRILSVGLSGRIALDSNSAAC